MKINQQQEDGGDMLNLSMDFTSHYLNDIAKPFDNHVGVYIYVS